MFTALPLLSFPEKLLQWLLSVDQWLFLQINTVWTLPVLDIIYPLWRDSDTWIPFYLFLIVLALVNFGKKALPWILFAVITAALTDQISSTLVKGTFMRLRPCNEPELVGRMRLLLEHCSGGFSFTSSHATNHFGFAMYVFLTTRQWLGKTGKWLFVWAGTIAYGQVYVGVHYPLDILCGALLGCLVGYGTARFFNRYIGLPDPAETISIS